MTFAEYLEKYGVQDGLRSVLNTIAGILPEVAKSLKAGEQGYAGTQNVYGEKQLKLDVISNKLFTDSLRKNPNVSLLASEEMDTEIIGSAKEEGYAVAFDPLDGSSLVDVNLAVGSIFGVYGGKSFIGRRGSEQVAALIAVYGPRLTFMVSVGKGVAEFLFDEATQTFILQKEKIVLDAEKKMFSPGNLRACGSLVWYMELLNYWARNGYLLRYSGGMVPDLNQILKKGGGIFAFPGYSEMPDGKLRLLYECAPMAYIVEQAGGKADWGRGRILDLEIRKLDQRTPIFLGSTKEVETALDYLKG